MMSQVLDDDQASSCSSNSEVARLEEIGVILQGINISKLFY